VAAGGSKVEAARSTLSSLFPRWSGVYIVIYEKDAPKWISFAGFSGD